MLGTGALQMSHLGVLMLQNWLFLCRVFLVGPSLPGLPISSSGASLFFASIVLSLPSLSWDVPSIVRFVAEREKKKKNVMIMMRMMWMKIIDRMIVKWVAGGGEMRVQRRLRWGWWWRRQEVNHGGQDGKKMMMMEFEMMRKMMKKKLDIVDVEVRMHMNKEEGG